MELKNRKYGIPLLLASLICAAAILVYLYKSCLIFVKYAEHGVLKQKIELESNYRYIFLIDGAEASFETDDKTVSIQRSVVNFKYRGDKIVRITGYPQPLSERVMAKSSSSIDLEYSGTIGLCKKTSAYVISEGEIRVKPMSSVIAGTSNVSSYRDRRGRIKTLILDGEWAPASIRVGIKSGGFSSLQHQSIEFISDGKMLLQDKKAHISVKISARNGITLTPCGSGIVAEIGGSRQVYKNRLYISPGENSSGIDILSFKRGYGFATYPGTFEITEADGKLNVINEASLEDYLKRVVPSEMPSSFGLEALKAQSVAARTYALSDMYGGRFSSSGFHVDDSTMSQVYNNSPENELATKAVNSTRGIVMTYEGSLADAKYYSTSHGYGANSGDIWSTGDVFPGDDKPYLVVGNYLIGSDKYDLSSEEGASSFFKNWSLKGFDSSSPYFRWKVEMTGQEVVNTLEKNLPVTYKNQRNCILTLSGGKYKSLPIPAHCLGTLTGISVTKRGQGGNIMEMVASGSRGSYKIIKELNVRYALRPRKSDTGCGRDIIIKRISGSPLENSSMLPSAFMVIETAKGKDGSVSSVSIFGGGYGHGVGMSQYGAGYLSSKGYGYMEILHTYYKNVSFGYIYK